MPIVGVFHEEETDRGLETVEYELEYEYSEPIPATWYDPPEGGIEDMTFFINGEQVNDERDIPPAIRYHLIDEAYAAESE